MAPILQRKKKLRLQNIPPNEIIEIILSNLPVKSLLRFKCVSKQWCCLFSSPNFKRSSNIVYQYGVGTIIAMYKSPLPTQGQRWSFRPSFTLINQQLAMEELDCSPLLKRREFSKRRRNSFMILGSCHGLILINVDEHIYLWNPAIRCCTKVLELYYLAWKNKFTTLGGLCFDSSKNDYKVIMFTYSYHLSEGVKFVTIASLKDKEWRLLKFPYDIRSIRDGITLHGRLHYRVRNKKEENIYDDDDDDDNVIYFDPISEKFHMFPIPDGKNPIVGLGVLKECLCISRLDYDKGHVEISVMKEYGDKKSWTSLYFIDNSYHVFHRLEAPFLVIENEESLLTFQYKRNVVVYLKNDNYMPRNILIEGNTNRIISGAITYVESLISPTQYRWSDKWHKKFARRAEQLLSHGRVFFNYYD